MAKRKGFTLIELLVVIAIIALLMSILMPALARVRSAAKAVVCQANLKQFGLAFAMYTSNNNGFFNAGWWPQGLGGKSHQWTHDILPYYGDIKLLLCPMANKFKGAPDSVYGGTFGAWSYSGPGLYAEGFFPEDGYGDGSYGINEFVSNARIPNRIGFGDESEWWRTCNVRGAERVPLLLDSAWAGGFPKSGKQTPPDWNYTDVGAVGLSFIRLHCRDRHTGYVNSLFMDFSARKVGLKELWTFEWCRGDDNANIYTIAGHSGNKASCAATWDAAARWMKNMKEY